MGKKIEKQKKEYEDKISFLLLQLRSAEVKAQANSSMLRKSFEKTQSARNQRSAEDNVSNSNESQISSSALAYIRPRPRTAQSYIDNSNSESGVDLARGRDDLLHKYLSEKERREILEKRNVELVRELRHQRQLQNL